VKRPQNPQKTGALANYGTNRAPLGGERIGGKRKREGPQSKAWVGKASGGPTRIDGGMQNSREKTKGGKKINWAEKTVGQKGATVPGPGGRKARPKKAQIPKEKKQSEEGGQTGLRERGGPKRGKNKNGKKQKTPRPRNSSGEETKKGKGKTQC